MGEVTAQWAAGFFDGEGTVDIRFRRTHGGKYERFELRAQIVQRDPAPLLLVAERYGGSVQGNGHGCHAWVASSRTAEAFLRDIAPHSICKADQIAVALRFAARLSIPGQQMRNSGRRGFALLSAEERAARAALMLELRGIRDSAGLRAKARRHPIQAEAAVYAVSRDAKALENHRSASAGGQDSGLH